MSLHLLLSLQCLTSAQHFWMKIENSGILTITLLAPSLEIQQDLKMNWNQVLNSQNLALVVGGKKGHQIIKREKILVAVNTVSHKAQVSRVGYRMHIFLSFFHHHFLIFQVLFSKHAY